MWLSLLMLIGCNGPSEETFIPELRVVAVVNEPPVVAPGDTVRSRVVIADPESRGVEAAVWMCTPIGPTTCAESVMPSPQKVSSYSHVVRGQTDFTVDFLISMSAAANIGGEKPPRIAVFACEAGLCPEFAAIEADPEPGTLAWDELTLTLAKPFFWLDEKPIGGVSLASRFLELTNQPIENRRTNPVLRFTSRPSQLIRAGKTLDLDFSVESSIPTLVYGFTDFGAMGPRVAEVVDGNASLLWAPGEEPGKANFWVSAEDGLGGSALWTGEAEAVD